MYCKYCGHELPDESNFCTMCGRVVDDANNKDWTDAVDDAAFREEAPWKKANEEAKGSLATKILTFGILGLAFGMTGWLALLGIIFSSISKRAIRKYNEMFGETTGRASVGRGLSTAGLVISIVATVFVGIYLIYWFVAMAALGGVDFGEALDEFFYDLFVK